MAHIWHYPPGVLISQNEAAAMLVFQISRNMAEGVDIDTEKEVDKISGKDVDQSLRFNQLSDCGKKLDLHVRKRYIKKISIIGIDPVLIPEVKLDPECLPPVEAADLLSFLVLETSYYTNKQFKAFRSLLAYTQMVSGFITSVQGQIIANKHVVIGKVRHLQRMNDSPVPLWIITEKDGTIICAHCVGSMAGLGECCSHVASVLFYLEVWTRLHGKLACTQVKCTWLLPTYVKEISYAPIQDIDFTSAKKLKNKLDASIEGLGENPVTSTPKAPSRPGKEPSPPSLAEMNNFYKSLNSCKVKPVALSLVKPYAEDFISKSRDIPTISDLFNEKYLTLEYHDLLKACTDIKVEITEKEIKLIEKDTRKQSKGTSFYHHRAGRIRASVCKQACNTNPAQPSQSLIKSLCYPNLFKFMTAATQHGCKHENQAIAAFETSMKKQHVNYRTIKCGMFINKQYPWLHATPDFLSWCKCCGYGCGEVKCPYFLDGIDFQSYVKKSSSCLEMQDGNMKLKRDHQYYFQVQQQLFTTDLLFCDFIVCGFSEQAAVFINERIYPDREHWDVVVPQLSTFWTYCTLPEILGRWYTKKSHLLKQPGDSQEICFCRMHTGESVVNFPTHLARYPNPIHHV